MHSFMAQGGDGFKVFENCELDQSRDPKKNIVLIHELAHLNEYLLKGYPEKYPNRLSIIEKDG